VAAWQVSNPPILAAAPLLASLAIFTEARLERCAPNRCSLRTFSSGCCARSRLRCTSSRRASPRGAAVSCRCASSDGAARGTRVFEGARRTRHGVRLARARHHPGGAGAVIQPLLKTPGWFARALSEVLRESA